MANMFMGPLENDMYGGGQGWLPTKWIILSTWLLDVCSAELTFWWVFTWDLSIFTSFDHMRDLSTCFFPFCPSQQFFNHSLSLWQLSHPLFVSDDSLNHHTLPNKGMTMTTSRSSELWWFPFICVFLGCLRNIFSCCSSLLDGACITGRILSKTGPSHLSHFLFFLFNYFIFLFCLLDIFRGHLTVRHTPRVTRYIHDSKGHWTGVLGPIHPDTEA